MTSLCARGSAALLAIAAVVAAPITAGAQDGPDPASVERAQRLFAEAEEAYNGHRYASAARLFRQVHELMEGHPRQYLVLFNLGQCLADAGEYEEAISALRQYLSEGGTDIENRGEVEARIAQLEDLMGGDQTSGPSGPEEGFLTGSIVSFAVGGAGLVAMSIFGGLALAEHDSLAEGCGATSSCAEEDIAASDTYALVADIMLGIGAAGVATGVGLLIAALASGSSEESDQAGLELTPWVTANCAGVLGVTTW